MPSETSLRTSRLQARAVRLAFALFVLVFVVHFSAMAANGVNVPFWDEWDLLMSDALPRGMTQEWLFRQHNEHRIVFTKLQIWLLLTLDGWNVVHQQIFNFLLFGVVLLLFYRLFRDQPLGRAPLIAFLLFALSPLNYENHSWGFQSHFHFVLLFLFMAIAQLFRAKPKPTHYLVGTALLLCAMFSFSNGLVAAVAVAFVFAVSQFSGVAGSDQRLATTAAVVGGVLGGAFLWSLDFTKPSYHPPYSWPNETAFWQFVGSLASFGFGWERVSTGLSIAAFLVVLIPLAIVVPRLRPSDSCEWKLVATAAAILAMLATVAIGRGQFGPQAAKSSRYVEFAVWLVPLSALLWARVLPRPQVHVATAFVWLCAAVGYADNWSAEPYRNIRTGREEGKRCLQQVLQGTAERCPQIYHSPLTDQVQQARALGASFTE